MHASVSLQRNVTALHYTIKMGRPKEHDARTAALLLDAAERLAAAHGLRALSIRALADEVGTTTRAIYSLFGSKDGLVAALGARAFDLLAETVDALPETADAGHDLVEAGLRGFRQFAMEHRALFQLGIQQAGTTPAQLIKIRAAAARAWTKLQGRVIRLQQQRQLDSLNPDEAATAFHALCEGLAALEMRGVLPLDAAEDLWKDSLTALVNGLTAGAASRSPIDTSTGKEALP